MFFHAFSIKAILRKVQINIRKSKLNESHVYPCAENLSSLALDT